MARKPAPRLTRALLQHYAQHRRPLPWRSDPTPYHVLLSEFMCQQTRVATAVPYYQRFIQRWPTIESLAQATDEQITEAWAGLGYYSRARRLLACAQRAVTLGGLPNTVKELQTLPGIGPYTAGAIASIAFGVRTPAVDGNVLRVLSRYLALNERIDAPMGRRLIQAEMLAWHTEGHPGDLNQAFMELGATLCSPTSPDCAACPIAPQCRARQQGCVGEYPRKAPRKRPTKVGGAVLLAQKQDRVLMIRPPPDQLLGGLWTPPFVMGVVPEVLPGILEDLGLRRVLDLGTIRHIFSHRDFQPNVFHSYDAPRAKNGRWVSLVDPGVGLSALAHKVLAHLHNTPVGMLAADDTPWSTTDRDASEGACRVSLD